MKQTGLLKFVMLLVLLCLASEAGAGEAHAKVDSCAKLSGSQRDTAVGVLKSQHAYECCDKTLHECLQAKKVCRVVRRIADDVCSRAAQGQSKSEIQRALAHRALTATGPKVKIDLSSAPVAGDSAAKVNIVLYVCPRCPYCARLTPQLYKSVTTGALGSKAKLYIRAFPLRDHKHSTISAMAWMAAQKLGHFWDMLLKMYADHERAPNQLVEFARAVGMDGSAFQKLLKSSELRKKLVASKKEGIRNQVDVTPSVFIDGRRYHGDLGQSAIEEMVMERHERVTGRKY